MLPIIALSGLVCVLLVVALSTAKRPRSSSPFGPSRDEPPAPQLIQSAPHSPLPTLSAAIDNRTLRQRQIDEDAALLSSEFARHEEERYRAEVRDRAGRAFAPPAPSATAHIPAPAQRPVATV